ncbi:multidrug effflux MFS transporter [Ancrocorticia populi]|uniref:multidrug effflux MFS transporter n=1 Tax=Ancrocorticia populi TaxID=2175228 RepID=UPI001403B568|nr:multidrug effflux MFS transporter [Ancrocorticia populi]
MSKANSSSAEGTPLNIVIVVACLTGASPLATDMYLAAFPAMRSEFGVSSGAVQLTITLFMLGFGVGQYLIGALSDLWGRRGLLLGGTVLAVAGSVLAAVAPTIELLWLARLIQGLGTASGAVLGRAIVADTSRGFRLAKQLSLMMMIQGVLPIVAPVLGSLLAGVIGWRGIMWVIAGYSAILLVFAIFIVPETLPGERRARISVGRAMTAPLDVLRSGPFLCFALGFVTAFGVLFAYISGSSFVLQSVFGLSQTGYGLVFTINALAMVSGSAINARLLGRFTQRQLTIAGTYALVAGCLAATVSGLLYPNLALFVGAVTIASLGVAHVLPNLTSLGLAALPRESQGSGSAVIGTGQALVAASTAPLVQIGGAISPLSVGTVMFCFSLLTVCAVTFGFRSATSAAS